MNPKQLHTSWLRAAAQFTNAHQQLEDELVRMRERKINQEYVDKKDDQIEALVSFYNQTDEIIQAYRIALANMKVENHFLTEMLLKKCTLQDVMQYKPSAQIIIQKLDETELPQTLSNING